MKKISLFFLLLNFASVVVAQTKIEKYYEENKGDNLPSKSVGTVSEGKLQHAKLLPFSGENFFYYSEESYLQGRAYTHSNVMKALLATYEELNKVYPGRKLGIMECSKKEGGKIWPHRTHQNGLSVDFMTPLIQQGKPYYGLDNGSGAHGHYLLSFDDQGRYSKDTTISIDFNLLAHHILLLDKQARKNGIKISKIILKIELKDELFETPYGKKLKQSGIYMAQVLPDMVNNVHDDHYHIDFSELPK